MRQTSWIATAAALILALYLVYLMTAPKRQTIRPLTEMQVTAMLKQGDEALHRKDLNGIFNLLAPHVKILGVSQDRLRATLARDFQETGPLIATWKNLQFYGGQTSATATFTLMVGEDIPGMEARYFNYPITIILKPVKIPTYFGLFHTTQWRITNVQTNVPVDFEGP
ncbi:MAG: hypothetical protein M1330_03180 [Armatimonadetes bacterium]|nr:hypothetical protein [Armatimonadota bacterium]